MASEYIVPCWFCASEFDAAASAWCSHAEATKVCPFCLRCSCDASEEYKKKFWDGCPGKLQEERKIFQEQTQQRLGEMLVKSGKITQQQLQDALFAQQAANCRLGEVLVSMALIRPEDLTLFLVSQKQLEEIDLSTADVAPALVSRIGKETCLKYQVVPIDMQRFQNREFLRLAVGSIKEWNRVKKASEFQPFSLIPYLAKREMIQRYFALLEDEERSLGTFSSLKNADAIEYFNRILKRAVLSGYSDLFCEFKNKRLRIFYQDNDRLLPVEESGLDETELFRTVKRIAGIEEQKGDEVQKSVVQLSKSFNHIQIRVFYFPGAKEENIRLKIINLNHLRDGLSEGQWDAQELEMIRLALSWSTGLFLVAGTRSSRLCEMLYSLMYGLGGEVVATVETVVLARNERFFQIEKEEQEIDRNILDGLLIHNPHSLFLFDFFDKQFSPEFMDFVSAGKLFLGLHAFSYESIADRLIEEFEIPFEFLSHYLRLIIFLREIHILCPHCRQKDTQSLSQRMPQLVFSRDFPLYVEKGCPHCAHTGHIRTDPIGEALALTDADRAEFAINDFSRLPKRISLQGNMTIAKKAMNLMLKGEVSFKEYSRFF